MFARNYKMLVRDLTTVKEFSNEFGMDFVLDKCAKATFVGGLFK